jgi:cyanuric acid amidohydrolase
VARVVNVLAKAEADPTGQVRDRRHTMLDDSDINSTRHARAVVNGVIASVVGDPMLYVSGGAEHQGPAGGGPVAVIARIDQSN